MVVVVVAGIADNAAIAVSTSQSTQKTQTLDLSASLMIGSGCRGRRRRGGMVGSIQTTLVGPKPIKQTTTAAILVVVVVVAGIVGRSICCCSGSGW